MPALKHSYDYIENEEIKEKRSYKAAPIKKTERKEQTGKKKAVNKVTVINFVLLVFSGILALAFTVVYSFVAISETKLTKMHAQISELNYENIDLENKLENVKSYYSVDTKVSSTADFDKAKHVLEVNHKNPKIVQHNENVANNLNTVTGF